MIRFLADENLNGDILSGLRRQRPDLDIVRVQDVGMTGAPDEEVLEWAARQNRVVLTHDVGTMTGYAHARLGRGLPMPGVFEISPRARLSDLIGDILLLVTCGREEDWKGQILYLPLRH